MTKKTASFLLATLLLLFAFISVFAYLGTAKLVTHDPENLQKLPDISYNPLTKRYLVVWQRYDNSNNGQSDIYGNVLDQDLNSVTGDFRIAGTVDYYGHPINDKNPKVACSNSDFWIVAWTQEDPNLLTVPCIWIVTVGSSGNASDPHHAATTWDHTADYPDIGGSTSNGRFLIVWEIINDLNRYEVWEGFSIQ